MADEARDELLESLTAVIQVLGSSCDHVEAVRQRAQELHEGRARGKTYAELVSEATGPLVVQLVSDLLDGLFVSGSRLRRAEARALHADGMSMDKIAHLLGVSRQRV